MQIFAHRGASAHAPENTLLAFEIAVEQGADGIEIDVHEHNGEFWVLHDRWLHRTTSGSGRLQDHASDVIEQLDAGQRQSIPTLAQAMNLIGGRCELNIEMKGIVHPHLLLDYVDNACQHTGFTHPQLLFSSFDHHLLKALSDLAPTFRLGGLVAGKPIDYAAFAQSLGCWSVHCDVGFVDKAFVDDAHQRGLKILVYTVDEKEDLLQLADWGVDGVFSNSPVHARELLQFRG
ncbi:glycerophosphodiester phosphodiesterase [Aestuariibacter halophilus]|uniref:Glycerophosphodiester phosphodiesterase n=1 Tax=Fluctibacter halophilus TaxID=226011 RepID=A0ABS8GDR5_9ALTE|nr:glycerophosphodiester phosphodiesterase family protein [Aestuariibacter halophilus]MCC2617341.1 glycerophosphodiester phosphodiesterase [Aestuariibacter halophilus]